MSRFLWASSVTLTDTIDTCAASTTFQTTYSSGAIHWWKVKLQLVRFLDSGQLQLTMEPDGENLGGIEPTKTATTKDTCCLTSISWESRVALTDTIDTWTKTTAFQVVGTSWANNLQRKENPSILESIKTSQCNLWGCILSSFPTRHKSQAQKPDLFDRMIQWIQKNIDKCHWHTSHGHCTANYCFLLGTLWIHFQNTFLHLDFTLEIGEVCFVLFAQLTVTEGWGHKAQKCETSNL